MDLNTPTQDTASARFARSLPHLTLFAVLGSFLVLAERKSPLYTKLLQEDGWAEWATFTAFSIAAFFGIRAAREVSAPRLARVSALLLGLFCLFVAGEEISWGQRLFGFRPPNFFLEQNYQQEANLHNLLKNILDTRFMVMAIALSFGVLAPYLSRVTRYPRELAAEFSLLPWFTAVAWLEFAYPYELVGEFAELVLGLLFLIELQGRDAALRAAAHPEARFSLPVRSSLALGAACLSALVIMPLNDLMLSWNREAFAAAARDDLTTFRERLSQGKLVSSKMLRKKRIHKRVYTAVRAGYLKLDPERFYLDPWNNPYWVVYQRDASGDTDSGTAILYSFGPNRRRDLPLREAENGDLENLDGSLPVGDDILVVLKLKQEPRASR